MKTNRDSEKRGAVGIAEAIGTIPQHRSIASVSPFHGTINVVYGPADLDMHLAGFTVEEIQISLCDVLGLGQDAEAYSDGILVKDKSTVVAAGRLEFVKPWGQKGIGKTYTKEEFMQAFHMTEADWSDWAAEGLPFDTMRDGTIVISETEVDQWKLRRGQETEATNEVVAKKSGSTVGGMLRLKDAAEYIGTTASGLRKLVDKKEIRYFQRKVHSPILFKPEWLDDYIGCHTHDWEEQTPTAPPRRKKQGIKAPNKPAEGRLGFRWDWMKK
jgi:hypothetical protein